MSLIDGQNASQSDNAALAPSEDEDFDAAFAEFASDPLAPDTSAADAGSTESSNTGAVERPAPAPAAATEPTAGATASPAQATTHDDIWENADPQLRQAHLDAIRDANLRLEGVKGRQSASDRELQRLRGRLADLEGRNGTGSEPQPRQDEQANEAGGKPATLTPDALKQLRDDYPELAGPLLDAIEGVRGDLSKLQAPVGAIQQEKALAAITVQETLLTEKHPDWQNTAADDRFAGWLNTQPQAIKEAMQRNFDAIVDGEEAALVIGKFKADLGVGAPSTPAPSPAPAQERRQRQIASGRDFGRTGPSVTTGIPDDFDAAVDAFMPKG